MCVSFDQFMAGSLRLVFPQESHASDPSGEVGLEHQCWWVWRSLDTCCKGVGCLTFFNKKRQVSVVKKWPKRLFRGCVGDYTTQLNGDYNKPTMRIPIKQPVFNGTYPSFFFSWLTWRALFFFVCCEATWQLQGIISVHIVPMNEINVLCKLSI